MAEAKLDVVGCGSMVVDLFYRTPRIIGGEEKIVLQAHGGGAAMERALVGGLTLNHLGWARVLGLDAGIFGKLGDDRHGEFLRAGMERLGIRHHLTFDGSASSFATVFVDSAGERAIYMARGATAELTPGEVRSRHGAFIRRAQIVTTEISQLPLPTVIAILLYARSHSIPTVLDFDVPPRDSVPTLGTRSELNRALKLATILKPAKSAARELIGATRDVLKMAEAMRDRYGSRAVIVTDGERGCAIAAKGASIRVPAFRAKAVDSTGAGDAFLGGVLAGLRWGLGWEQLGRLANAAGAVCVSRLGAFPSGFEVREEIFDYFGEVPQAAREAGAAISRASAGAGPRDYQRDIESFFDEAVAELVNLKDDIDVHAITRAAEMIRAAENARGRLHITGVGKPEHVARYAASLLCSIGTPATFLHATETLHGSLGQVHRRDVVIAISNSGSTRELLEAAAAIKEHGARLIAITGNRDSELARLA
ncbi:MAG: PfkB family carbohydrate kinase, partial [Candidatus Binataceae bacterium]